MEATTSDAVAKVRAVFEGLADDYDQSGVAFFQPIADRLCELVAPAAGEDILDIGSGRGAVTVRLIEAGAEVTAVDLSPTMVEHTRRAAARVGVATVLEGDATRLDLPEHSFDAIVSSLVLFFLPDPAAAARQWLRLLREDGRFGITTFGPADPVFEEVSALFVPFHPPGLLDPKADRGDDPFASDESVSRLLSDAGAIDVRTVREALPVSFPDVHAWRAWTMSTGQRLFWSRMGEAEQGRVMAEAERILESAREGSGPIVLHQDVRYTLGRT